VTASLYRAPAKNASSPVPVRRPKVVENRRSVRNAAMPLPLAAIARSSPRKVVGLAKSGFDVPPENRRVPFVGSWRGRW
jgi:hypothetical protein